MTKKRYNEEFIDILDKLHMLMLKQGEVFRARAYQKAQNTIINHKESIFEPEQLKGLPGIGTTIMEKLNEYVQTGKLQVLEREKDNPYNLFCEIHGIGPKKAQELVDAGIASIKMLREKQDEYLNNVQKTGLKYYEDVQKRIPRSEIDEYKNIFTNFFLRENQGTEYAFEIVGSYRRGAKDSGDIDVIITGKDGKMYKKMVDELLAQKVILEVLSRGTSKTLVIAKLPGLNKTARRIDFLYSPPDEFAFSTLYFTGSKYFNTAMRQRALDMGYTLNEHGICKMVQGKKGALVDKTFPTEQSIFEFLGLVYKEPKERIDQGSCVPRTPDL
jgi:DNA polymerase beta